MSHIVLICFITILAAIIQAASGFGYGLILMALFPLFFSIPDSIILILLSNMVGMTYITLKYVKFVNWKIFIIPALLSLIGNYFGLVGILSIDNDLGIKFLGILLVMLSLYFFFFSNRITIPNNHISASITGALSGLMGGFFNIPGPPVVLYYSVATKTKEEYMGTLQMFFSVGVILKIVYLFLNHDISKETISYLPFLAVAALAGTLIGNFVFKKISVRHIKNAIYIVMALSGIYYVIM